MVLVYSFTVDGKVYVGITENPKYRWRPSAYRKERLFYNFILEYGWKNIKKTVQILLATDDRDEALMLEGNLINQYKKLGISLNNYQSGKIWSKNPQEYRNQWMRDYRATKKAKNNQ